MHRHFSEIVLKHQPPYFIYSDNSKYKAVYLLLSLKCINHTHIVSQYAIQLLYSYPLLPPFLREQLQPIPQSSSAGGEHVETRCWSSSYEVFHWHCVFITARWMHTLFLCLFVIFPSLYLGKYNSPLLYVRLSSFQIPFPSHSLSTNGIDIDLLCFYVFFLLKWGITEYKC